LKTAKSVKTIYMAMTQEEIDSVYAGVSRIGKVIYSLLNGCEEVSRGVYEG